MEGKILLSREVLRQCLMAGVAIGLKIKDAYGLSDEDALKTFAIYLQEDNSIIEIIQSIYEKDKTWEQIKNQLGL